MRQEKAFECNNGPQSPSYIRQRHNFWPLHERKVNSKRNCVWNTEDYSCRAELNAHVCLNQYKPNEKAVEFIQMSILEQFYFLRCYHWEKQMIPGERAIAGRKATTRKLWAHTSRSFSIV